MTEKVILQPLSISAIYDAYIDLCEKLGKTAEMAKKTLEKRHF